MGITFLKHVLMDEADPNPAAGGGGDPAAAAAAAAAVKAGDARKFVADFVHDPKALETMKDEDVVAYHTRLTQTIDKVRPKGGAWPEKWREELAGGDAELAKRFERYQSPKDIANALVAAQNKIRSGELKESKPFPDKGTDAEKQAWFKENGLPESPDKYELKLKDGLVVGKDDKPIIDGFLKSAHGARMNSAQASAAVDWYYEEMDRQTAAREQADREVARQTTDALNAEWGKEFRPNMNAIEALLETLPAPVKDSFKHGRLADGTPLLASKGVLEWLGLTARTINPVGIIAPGGSGNVATSIDDEIKQIEGWMGAKKGSADYRKYWDDEKAQARLRELYNARERVKGQGGK